MESSHNEEFKEEEVKEEEIKEKVVDKEDTITN